MKKCIGESGEVGDIANIVNIAMQKNCPGIEERENRKKSGVRNKRFSPFCTLFYVQRYYFFMTYTNKSAKNHRR